MFAFVFGTMIPWLTVGLGTWIGFQLIRQNGRILLQLESIQFQLGQRIGPQRQEPKGLPVGSVAPDFELPDLAGVPHKLSRFRDKDLLLLFFNPQCGFCTKVAADLAALPLEGTGGQAVPIVVTTGEVDENRKLVEKHGIRCLVLIQKNMEVASQYRAQGTPMGYRIDAKGRIASELAVGAEPLLKLAGKDWKLETRSLGKQPDPSLARSRINRDGLKAGTGAPEFRLPRIDEGELSLSDLRGERVLLVFSDPECGPCDELAPRLEELHREVRDLQVVVISRRDREATRAKAAKLGVTYPIVMQQQWEISLKYGMFATPIGYLIDAQGIVLRDVAVGVESILALADEHTPEPKPSVNGKEVAAI